MKDEIRNERKHKKLGGYFANTQYAGMYRDMRGGTREQTQGLSLSAEQPVDIETETEISGIRMPSQWRGQLPLALRPASVNQQIREIINSKQIKTVNIKDVNKEDIHISQDQFPNIYKADIGSNTFILKEIKINR